MNFFSRLNSLIDSNPLNQKALAAQLDIAESTLVNYRRDRIPKADELMRIAKHFGVSMEWLLTGSEFTNVNSGDMQAWRDRTLAAESKLVMLKAGIEGVLKKI